MIIAIRAPSCILTMVLCLTQASYAQDGDPSTNSPTEPVASQTAAVLPAGFYLEDLTPSSSFSAPVAVAFAPDGRIFVAEQRGRVYVVENDTKLEPPFINLESEVLNHWDRGLLGIAIDPNFAVNRYVYLLYTYDRDGSGDYQREDAAARLTRYAADVNNPNLADLSTRAVLIGTTFPEAIPSCYYSHTIGTLQFGTDGTLLVGAGDGADFTTIDPGGLHPDCFGPGKFGSAEDVGAFRSQYLGSLAGKILRVDPATGLGIPSNPFFTGNAADNQSRVWTRGLRNPFRFTLRRNGSTNPSDGNPGALYIGDVGWNTWEDLNVSTAGGENFGWPCYEGPNQHAGYQSASPDHSDCTLLTSNTAPQFYWHHSNASLSSPSGLQSRAVVVGDFYGGYKYPVEYRDRIYYAD